MRTPLRDRFAFWLERFAFLRPLIFKYDGPAPAGERYVSRLNGHVIVITEKGDVL